MSMQMYLAKLMRRADQMHGPHGRAFVVRMSEYSVLSERNTSSDIVRPQHMRALVHLCEELQTPKDLYRSGSSLSTCLPALPPQNKGSIPLWLVLRPPQNMPVRFTFLLTQYKHTSPIMICRLEENGVASPISKRETGTRLLMKKDTGTRTQKALIMP